MSDLHRLVDTTSAALNALIDERTKVTQLLDGGECPDKYRKEVEGIAKALFVATYDVSVAVSLLERRLP